MSTDSFPSIPDTDLLEHPAETLALRRLTLTNFRSYTRFDLEIGPEPVVITGHNGAGKTNILEAISFLSPGRGLRNAKLTDIDYAGAQPEDYLALPWGVSTLVDTGLGQTSIGTGRIEGSGKLAKRLVKIDGQAKRGQGELASVVSVLWVTPQMDPIFLSGTSERRRFLDRLVYAFDPAHAERVASYEYSMRERARLLQYHNPDPQWLLTLETKMAARGTAIAKARHETADILQHFIWKSETPFPKATVSAEGPVEQWLKTMAVEDAEAQFLHDLTHARREDAATGRTGVGPHRSDFVVIHDEKHMPAALCSTGEQKALLLSIVLAEARAKAEWKKSVPVVLLDEVVAHLDINRRAALFDEIKDLKAQAWLTGTDALLFDALKGYAQYLEIEKGMVKEG